MGLVVVEGAESVQGVGGRGVRRQAGHAAMEEVSRLTADEAEIGMVEPIHTWRERKGRENGACSKESACEKESEKVKEHSIEAARRKGWGRRYRRE